jgi:hypothetical protein
MKSYLAAAALVAACTRTPAPRDPTERALFRDLERQVTIAAATGWGVDRLEVEATGEHTPAPWKLRARTSRPPVACLSEPCPNLGRLATRPARSSLPSSQSDQSGLADRTASIEVTSFVDPDDTPHVGVG